MHGGIWTEHFLQKCSPEEDTTLFPSVFQCSQAPVNPLLGSRWLHFSAWSCSRVAWGDGEGGQWEGRSEGAALQEFCFSKGSECSLFLPVQLHCLLTFPLSLLHGDENHPCLQRRMKPALCPVFAQVFLGSQTPSACCHCCLKLAFVVPSRGPGCSIVPLVLFTAQSHNKSQSLPQIY